MQNNKRAADAIAKIEELKESVEEPKIIQKEYPWNRAYRRKVLGMKNYNFARRFTKRSKLNNRVMISKVHENYLKSMASEGV